MDEPLEVTGSIGLWFGLGLLTIHLLARNADNMGSTEAKRSFSCIRRICTWLGNTMTTERLSSLAVIAMHANAVTIDRGVVCEKFVALHPRRMTASTSLAD